MTVHVFQWESHHVIVLESNVPVWQLCCLSMTITLSSYEAVFHSMTTIHTQVWWKKRNANYLIECTMLSTSRACCCWLRHYQPSVPRANPFAKLFFWVQPMKSSVVGLWSCNIMFGDFTRMLLVLHTMFEM